MPNDPYPGATFMSPSHSATLFVFLPLCLNLTYSSNGVQSSPSFSRYSSPHLIPLLCVHPLPSLSLYSFALSTMHPYPLSTYPFNHSTSLVQPASSPHPVLFATFMCGLRLHADFWVSPTYLAPPHFLF